MSSTNETNHIEQHQTCKCRRRLDASVCNNKQFWNDKKCRCKSKELLEKGRCDTGFILNLSSCDGKCDKSCGIGQYLHYKNCKCKKDLISKLVEECRGSCHDVLQKAMNFNNTTIVSIKGSHYRIHFWYFWYMNIDDSVYIYILGVSSSF